MAISCKQKIILGTCTFIFIACTSASISCAIFGKKERDDSFKNYNVTDVTVIGYDATEQLCDDCNKWYFKIKDCSTNPYTAIIYLQYYAYVKGDLYKLYKTATNKIDDVFICGLNKTDAVIHAQKVWPEKKSIQISYSIDDPTQIQSVVFRGEIYILLAVLIAIVGIISVVIGVLYLCRQHNRVRVFYPPMVLFDV